MTEEERKRKARERKAAYRARLRKKVASQKPELCSLCGRKHTRIVLDHDHSTGMIRGWVCGYCNTILGVLDNPERLQLYYRFLKNSISGVSLAEHPTLRSAFAWDKGQESK